MLNLRPYQREAVDSLYSYWSGGGGNGLIVIPTGGGKSLVIATVVRELIAQWPAMRIIVVTHTRELVAQNFQELMRYWPQAPAGINSAALGRRDKRSQILFASIQSIFREDAFTLGERDLIIVDEAHLIPREGEGMYVTFLDKMRDATPDMRVLGLTATPYRMSTGRLDKGEGRMFDDIVFEANVADLIKDGFLSPLISKATASAFNVSGVAKRGGEFVAGALEAAVDKDWITRAAVAELVQFGHERKAWLVFCSGIKHAEHVRDEIRTHGISCEMVTGETPSGERDRIIKNYREGRIRCLTNANVLSIGFNVPAVDMVALMRPTLSCGLFVQQVGRAFRLAPGKQDALILDYAGNVRRFGPIDAVNVGRSGSGRDEAAIKEDSVRAKACPNCSSLTALNARVCQSCGHEWPREEAPKHDARADSERPIMSTGGAVWLPVNGVRYFRHSKPGSPTSMRVEYSCGLTVYRQWICFEHDGFAARKAESWWRRMASGGPPDTVEEALARQADIRPATDIQVRPSGSYFEVVSVRHDPPMMEAAE